MAKFLLYSVDSIAWLPDDNHNGQLCVTKFQKLCIEHDQKHVQTHQIETAVSTLKIKLTNTCKSVRCCMLVSNYYAVDQTCVCQDYSCMCVLSP